MDRHGQQDSEIAYNYAVRFVKTAKALMSGQMDLLLAARREMIGDLAPASKIIGNKEMEKMGREMRRSIFRIVERIRSCK